MKRSKFGKTLATLCLPLTMSACGMSTSAITTPAIDVASNALLGGGVGAAAGAAIGAIIKNGDVGRSALAGTAIGAPSGIVLGYVLNEPLMSLPDDGKTRGEDLLENQTRYDELSAENARLREQNEREIERLRRELYGDE